jgi:malate synthase
MTNAISLPGIALTVENTDRYGEVLTPDALAFVADLHRTFEAERRDLMNRRVARQKKWDAGALPDFLDETADIRSADWRVGAIPADLEDRRVEITGPTDRKMVINALNSGANVFMTDFEDANAPTWSNMIEGQLNLYDFARGNLEFTDSGTGKHYAIGDNPAVLLVRPRGWHLVEEHMLVDGDPVSSSIFDFGLYFFHNAKALIELSSGPYFYLPKLESHLEARLWNDVFIAAQKALGLPSGTIKATVLIETLPAAFEMDEILYEMRDHIVGLNCGRWDYIFSAIKTLRNNPKFVMPDRSQIVMGKAFLGAYARLLVQTCHKRGAYAMGGMAAQIPVKDDEAANEAAFEKVRADKEREARVGHDGTWVAHPGLVPVAKDVFDRLMPGPNQLDKFPDGGIGAKALLEIHTGTITEAGVRENIRVGVQYIEAWLGGRGAVPLYNLMEDAATAEISRAQIWQWIRHGAKTDAGQIVTEDWIRKLLDEEMVALREIIGAETYDEGNFTSAIGIFTDVALSKDFPAFLTLPAYELLK